MASALSRVLRSMTSKVAPVRRSFGSHSAGGVDEVEKWKKISIAATGFVIIFSLKEMVGLASHGHHEDDKPKPDYMKIRTKPYPWECSDCSLFDTECFNKCKEERRGSSAAH